MLRPDYPIHTERLLLRPFTLDDLDDAHAYQSLPEVVRYLYWKPRTREDVRQALVKRTRQDALSDDNDVLVLAVVWLEIGKVIGEVNLNWLSREHRQGETGFIFHPAYQGKGLAREASEVMLRLGFNDLGLNRIIGRCDPKNAPSWQLLERLSMRREAHFVHNEIFNGEWGDEYVYAMLADEWRAR
jgi:RimJ/RimL family protein N-acetyltransferase